MADKVKVGDMVRVTQHTGGYSGDYPVGSVGEVTSVEHFGEYVHLGGEMGAPHFILTDYTEPASTLESFPSVEETWRFETKAVEPKPKFKVGDKVVGLAGAPYGITGEGWTGVVTEVGGYSLPDIEVDGRFWVQSRFFALVEEEAEVIPFPTPTPTMFNGMSREERGELLLSQFEGKPLQFYNPLAGAWMDEDEDLNPEMAYRVKPAELIEAEREYEEYNNRVTALKATIDRLAA